MNYASTVQMIAEGHGISKRSVDTVLRAFSEVTTMALEGGDEVGIPGLGKFKVIERKARKGVNPQTGKKIKIPAKKAVKFTAAKALKDAVSDS